MNGKLIPCPYSNALSKGCLLQHRSNDVALVLRPPSYLEAISVRQCNFPRFRAPISASSTDRGPPMHRYAALVRRIGTASRTWGPYRCAKPPGIAIMHGYRLQVRAAAAVVPRSRPRVSSARGPICGRFSHQLTHIRPHAVGCTRLPDRHPAKPPHEGRSVARFAGGCHRWALVR